MFPKPWFSAEADFRLVVFAMPVLLGCAVGRIREEAGGDFRNHW